MGGKALADQGMAQCLQPWSVICVYDVIMIILLIIYVFSYGVKTFLTGRYIWIFFTILFSSIYSSIHVEVNAQG